MSKFSPARIDFETLEKFEKIRKIFIIIFGFVSICFTFNLNIGGYFLNSYANSFGITTIILVCISDYIYCYIFDLAEEKRKKDFIDNSFGTKLSLENSIEYYSNDNQKYGIRKLGINLFENCFFTVNVSDEMKKKEKIKIIIVFIFSFFIFIYGVSNISFIIPIAQLFLSKDFFLGYLNLYLFNYKMHKILDELIKIFQDSNKISSKNLAPKLTYLIIRYESILASYKLILDSEIYLDNNQKLSKDWNILKEKYKLNE